MADDEQAYPVPKGLAKGDPSLDASVTPGDKATGSGSDSDDKPDAPHPMAAPPAVNV